MVGDSAKSSTSPTSSATTGNGSSEGGAKDFSQTNVQIAGVDESETVKTDGKFAYYYNSKDHRVYVTDVRDPKNVQIVRKIRIPESYGNPELYVGSGKLVVFSNKYSTIPYSYRYWFDRSQKTVVVVYDVADPVNPKIERYFQIDGSVSKTRRVGRYLYLLSSSPLSFPYDRYFIGNPEAKYPVDQKLDSAKIDREFSVSKVMPKKLELSHTSLKDANFRQKGVLLPYRIESGAASTCGETEYVLPDAATLEKYSFSPTFTTLSIIDLENVNERVRTKVFFGDTSEIMMTPTSLYLTSQMYSDSGWKCPAYARCFQPFWNAGYESLVHKISINGLTAKYAATAVVSGSPLNQYSMDEGADGTFRIVTSESGDKTSTRVSVLDKNLSPLGTVANIAPGETFRSSRFIGNKLYLVTFEQIDPLFVIDLADAKNPKIEGELKIPGYSLYLHPYAPGKLIGLGYDTVTNQWGGTQNAGIKVDLYDVSDVKNPKRLSSLTLGGIGSSSDALWNPKLFTWYAAKNQLFLPVTLMEPSKLANEPYRYSGAFQGTVAFSIDPVSGIKETGRVTHIEAKDLSAERKKDCAQYATVETAPRCEKIIGGGEYCPPVSSYVPPYCYESSTDGEYFANQIWKYSDSFVTRNLYLDNALYTLSNVKMVGSDLTNAFSTLSVTEWK
jgi:inhibitor of cysteine peptidase